MARPETLIRGNCYFSVSFYDSDLVLPIIDTLVYVGQGSDHEAGRLWLFKEPERPSSPDEQDPSSEPPIVTAFSDSQLHQVVDFDGLLRRLREIAVDHPLTPVEQTAEAPATAEDFETLPAEVARFVNDAERVSVTMTIRFTDDALSLRRREGGYEMTFFAQPRQDPDEASRILALFAGMGVEPHVDYLSNRGQRRVLSLSSPDEPEAIADLCRRVLTEVHRMRRGDVLDYSVMRKSDLARLFAPPDGPR